jgi:tetratricopeptide (TPR) repeat protein
MLLSGSPLDGQTLPFDPEIRSCYLNLDTVKGNRLLKQKYSPDEPEFIRILGYREFLHNLLFQSKSNADRFLAQSGTWLKKLEKSGAVNGLVTAAIAEVHLYRAVIASQFSEYKASATELLAAYRVVAKSGTEFSISDRNKLSGILGVLFQQVPEKYGKYLRLLGVRPSGLSGFNGLERYYSASLPGSIERMEGYVLLITAYKEFSKDPATAWNFVKSEGAPMLENQLVRYQSALAALKAGDCESAVNLLKPESNLDIKPPFSYWNYQLGRCKLYRNDTDAISYLEQFIENPGGENYRHSAALFACWYYVLHGNQDKAKAFTLGMKDFPSPLSGYDREAMNEISSGQLPDPEVLKVRMRFDGGYFEECLAGCDHLIKSGRFSYGKVGELLYRKARCEQRLGRTSLAVGSFLGVLERADSVRSYIVPNSALQLGYLYKKTGQLELARKYFKTSMDLNKYGFRDGINRQAQVALEELEK